MDTETLIRSSRCSRSPIGNQFIVRVYVTDLFPYKDNVHLEDFRKVVVIFEKIREEGIRL